MRPLAPIAVVDAGPLVAAVDTNDIDHERSAAVFEGSAYRFAVPVLAVAEAVHFIGGRLGPLVEAAFIAGLTALSIESPTDEDWERIVELVRRYSDFPLGTVDASVIALAERLNTDLIVTLDQRHFRAVHPRHVPAFRLLPE